MRYNLYITNYITQLRYYPVQCWRVVTYTTNTMFQFYSKNRAYIRNNYIVYCYGERNTLIIRSYSCTFP